MAALTFTTNTNQTVATRGGIITIVALGSTIGGGTFTAQYQTPEMATNSVWADLTTGDAETPVVLSITTLDRGIAAYVPDSTLKFTLSGATSPSCTVYIDTVTQS